ncbi:MAG: ABC transporter permease subunit [Fimbriimonadaceae bacterium]
MNDALVLILSSVTLAAPLVLAAMGGLLSERSGVVNIALEGMMLTAACVTALGTASTGSPVLGLLLGVAAAIFVGLGHALLTQAFRIDHIISGIGLEAPSSCRRAYSRACSIPRTLCPLRSFGR